MCALTHFYLTNHYVVVIAIFFSYIEMNLFLLLAKSIALSRYSRGRLTSKCHQGCIVAKGGGGLFR